MCLAGSGESCCRKSGAALRSQVLVSQHGIVTVTAGQLFQFSPSIWSSGEYGKHEQNLRAVCAEAVSSTAGAAVCSATATPAFRHCWALQRTARRHLPACGGMVCCGRVGRLSKRWSCCCQLSQYCPVLSTVTASCDPSCELSQPRHTYRVSVGRVVKSSSCPRYAAVKDALVFFLLVR